MINLNNNIDFAFSKRKSGVFYGKPILSTRRDVPNGSTQKRNTPKKNKQKTKIVYVKEVKKPKKNKKK